MLCRFKDWRRIVTRFDRDLKNFMGAITLAAAVVRWLWWTRTLVYALQRQKSASATDAELGWLQAEPRLVVTAFIKNIEKSWVLTSSFVCPVTGNEREAFGLPTTYGVRVNMNF